VIAIRILVVGCDLCCLIDRPERSHDAVLSSSKIYWFGSRRL